MSRIILFLAILEIAFSVFPRQVPAERLPIKIFTSADGLGSSFVDGLKRDSKGFLWICSRDGLSRFDGSQFVTYQIGEPGAVVGVETISEQANGTYWVGTTSGLYRFTSETLSQANPGKNGRPLLNAEFIGTQRGHFFENQNGTLWFVSSGIYNVIDTDGKVTFERIDLHLPGDLSKGLNLTDHAETSDGSFWFNAPLGIVRRLPDGRVIFLKTDREVTQGTLLKDEHDRIWAARGREIFIINPEPIDQLSSLPEFTLRPIDPVRTVSLASGDSVEFPVDPGTCFRFTSETFLGKHTAKRLFQSFDKHIWLTTEENLVEYDGKKLHVYTPEEGFVPAMGRMAEDSAGNLWFGGYSGLVRLDRKGLITYDAADGLASSRVYSLMQDAAGRLYAGTGEMSISEFDGTAFNAVFPGIIPGSTTLWAGRFTLLDHTGDWWIATDKGLHHFTGVSRFSDLAGKRPAAVYNKSTGLPNDDAFHVFEDKQGDIWFSQLSTRTSRGLVRWTRATNEIHTFTQQDGFPGELAVSTFVEDAFGNIWMGLYEGGVIRYRNGKFTLFDREYGLPRNIITDSLLDGKGRLWFTSATGGLMRFDEPNSDRPVINYIKTENGLTTNNIRTITEDKFGRLYLGTARGVDRLSPETMRVKHYSVSDGLAADFVVDSLCDATGALWFATTNGVSRLEPTVETEQEAPKVLLGKLLIAGEEQPINELGAELVEKGELSSSQNNLQIDFFALDFRAGERLRYQYKLDGVDADWSAATEQRSVSFAKLSAGSYRFLVRAVNSDGAVSVAPAVVDFRILPPIWARWWFLLGAALLLASTIVWFYRYRLSNLRTINVALSEANLSEERLRHSREERLAELETVRARIATDLHDDIGASLTQIAVLSEVAEQSFGHNGNGSAKVPLSKISQVSNELVGTMSDIVWSINPSKDHLSDMTQRMRRFASDILTAQGITVAFRAPDLATDIAVNTNLRREVFLIFKESVTNIAKHSGATHVRINMDVSGADLTLRIEDDGNGFELEQSIHDTVGSNGMIGNGILSMRKRAREMNGDLNITSVAGAGTTVELFLSLDRGVDMSRAPNRSAQH